MSRLGVTNVCYGVVPAGVDPCYLLLIFQMIRKPITLIPVTLDGTVKSSQFRN